MAPDYIMISWKFEQQQLGFCFRNCHFLVIRILIFKWEQESMSHISTQMTVNEKGEEIVKYQWVWLSGHREIRNLSSIRSHGRISRRLNIPNLGARGHCGVPPFVNFKAQNWSRCVQKLSQTSRCKNKNKKKQRDFGRDQKGVVLWSPFWTQYI